MLRLTPAQWGKTLYEITKDLKADSDEFGRAIVSFAETLQRNYALKRVDAIIEAYEKYAKKQAGVKELIITTARKLRSEEMQEIEEQFGEKVESTAVVDPTIIGGVIVKSGNMILNGSISNQLEQLKHSL